MELVKGGVDSNHFHLLLETAFLCTTLQIVVGEVNGRARLAMLSRRGLGGGKSSLPKGRG